MGNRRGNSLRINALSSIRYQHHGAKASLATSSNISRNAIAPLWHSLSYRRATSVLIFSRELRAIAGGIMYRRASSPSNAHHHRAVTYRSKQAAYL